MTGVHRKVVTWLTVPKSAAAEDVPVTMASPPPITVMKALAMKAAPMVGNRPLTGASAAPASPVSAAPTPKVMV